MQKLLASCSIFLLALVGSAAARADTCNGVSNNLVSNCGFETGSFAGWSGTATTSSPNYAGVDNGDPFTTMRTPYQGSYEAYLGNVDSTIALTQTLATIAGATYSIEFALLNDASPSIGYTNSFAATFDGVSLFSESAVNAGAYSLYTLTGIASSNSTALSFISRNDAGYFELDSVSVSAATSAAVTPEPSSLLLMGTGLLGTMGVMRRRLTA